MMKRDEQGYLVFGNVTEWKEYTKYTDTTSSTAKSQAEIQRLLIDEYGAEEVIISERQGGQIVVAFRWKGKGYVIPVRRAKIKGENQKQVARLQRQAMRVLRWYLKNLLLMRFLTSEEELLMPHMMLQTSQGNVRAADAILGGLLRPALPEGKKPENGKDVEGEFQVIEAGE